VEAKSHTYTAKYRGRPIGVVVRAADSGHRGLEFESTLHLYREIMCEISNLD